MSRAILLVGHGGVPTNFPGRDVLELKRLAGERHRRAATGGEAAVTPEEAALEEKIRTWPRTPSNDPYLQGFEGLAAALRSRTPHAVFTAYNEFCAPTIAQAVARANESGVSDLLVLTSMLTPGGSHAALEIPELLDACRSSYPQMNITYAWPFPVDAIAAFFAEHIGQYWSK